SRLRLEMTVVSSALSPSPTLKADTGVSRKSQDILGQGALPLKAPPPAPLAQFGRGASSGGQLSGQQDRRTRLFLWLLHCCLLRPLHGCPRRRKDGIGGEQVGLLAELPLELPNWQSLQLLTPVRKRAVQNSPRSAA
ncbi:MAG TPA: hypothetical protein VKV18_04905, partial [Chthonomonas sp.]|uniref:hypothetical protein n=1 Tax=Chthonomonas sp. TaxID=2282153 RepID=UPI002B4B3A05